MQVTQANWTGPLWGTLAFFAVPAGLLIIPAALGLQIPVPLLYFVAAIAGSVLAVRSISNPEWLLAAFVLYVPFNRIYVVPIAPGVNGTNALLVLLLFAWSLRVSREGRPVFAAMPFSRLVAWWALLSTGSVITAIWTMGLNFIADDRLPQVKAWIDHFVMFFAFINLIRDGAMARRVAVYMMAGTLLVTLFSFDEWTEKRFLDRIDKARLLGPQLQPNDLGAFLVYGMGVPAALLLNNLFRLRALFGLGIPLLVLARVLLATFSRGAFIGAGLLASVLFLVRGKILFAVIAVAGMILVNVAPEVLPTAFTDRMGQTNSDDNGKIDKSSETRLILWKAALEVTADNPLFGAGFATFKAIKGRYTEVDVEEADNHNMYLYICSQMGIPTLVVFLLIIAYMFARAAKLHSRAADPFARAFGLGAAATAAGVLGINMFGSRMVDMNVMAYVWITIAVLSHLQVESQQGERA